MTRRQLRALALSTALLPISAIAVLLTNALRGTDVRLNIDPFEIDLQLTERNDA